MYKNVGKTIKNYVKLVFAFSIIAIVIIDVAVISVAADNGDGGDAAIIMAVFSIIALIASWMSTWILYGYGEIVDRSISIDDRLGVLDSRVSTIMFQKTANSTNSSVAPGPTASPIDVSERNKKLLELYNNGLITKEEYMARVNER